MKLRLKNGSIRYRLTRTDVAELSELGIIEDKVDFGEQSLFYAIQLTDEDKLRSTLINNTIILYMPRVMIDELQNTDRTGFENNNDHLHLLVEKDFTCLDNVAEDQSDNYPNPLAAKLYEAKN
jgi:hypothetical protein